MEVGAEGAEVRDVLPRFREAIALSFDKPARPGAIRLDPWILGLYVYVYVPGNAGLFGFLMQEIFETSWRQCMFEWHTLLPG